MPVIYFLAMLIVLGCGINVLWINSRRLINQIFAGICFICVLYFAFTLVSRYEANRYLVEHVYRGLPWVRLTWTTTALMPLYLWALFYVVSGNYRSRRDLFWKLLPWVAVSLALVVTVWTQAFITRANLPDRRTPGLGFWLFQIVLLVSASVLLVRSVVLARSLKGIRKVEFQYLTINCAALSVFAVLLPLLTFLPVELRKLVTLPIVCYGITGWALASRRVYHSTHIYLSVVEHALLLVGVGFGTLWTIQLSDQLGANVYARVAVIGLFSLAGYYGHEFLRRSLHLKPEQQLQMVRQLLGRVAEGESNPDLLLQHYETVLAEWAQTPRVNIMRLDAGGYVGRTFTLPVALLKRAKTFNEGWVTTVTLTRVRMDATDRELMATLAREKLGAIVAGVWNESTPAFLIAVGERENELPFTYPEVQHFQELAHVIDGHYTSARLRLQARQAEQLAAIGRVGACLAHELRNPMETLRTFSEMIPARVNDPVFLAEFAEIIPKEVDRALALAGQVLDMARPRQYQFGVVDLHALIEETTRPLMQTAREMDTVLLLSLKAERHGVMADSHALRQVLINLVNNAIEAVAQTEEKRVVVVSSRDEAERVFVEVEDNGPGIPGDIRARLFTPFATSGKKGGLGLGLAICEEIIKSHGGTITAEAAPGGGSMFRVALPLHGEVRESSA